MGATLFFGSRYVACLFAHVSLCLLIHHSHCLNDKHNFSVSSWLGLLLGDNKASACYLVLPPLTPSFSGLSGIEEHVNALVRATRDLSNNAITVIPEGLLDDTTELKKL